MAAAASHRGAVAQPSLAGLTALVTGAGTGLGRAMAEGLSAAGAALVLVGRRAEKLEEAAAAMTRSEAMAATIIADVTVDADVTRIAREAGAVDILVNNAGSSDRQPWTGVSATDWDRILDLNLKAAFRLSQAFAPAMMAKGSGRIINIASIYGMLAPDRSLYADTASFDLPSYGASKAGLIGMTRHLAAILGPHGVTVNCISPGMFETERTATLLAPATRAALLARTPARRLGIAQDIAAAAVYLASPGASFVTGQNLVVDGGFSLL